MIASPNLIKALVELAEALDKPEIQDNLTPATKRELRQLASNVRASLEEQLGDLTAPVLFGFYMGTAMQAAMGPKDPRALLQGMLSGNGGSPHPAVSLAVAYLARDILSGEAVQ